VPIDEFGGWREQWYVYLIAQKPSYVMATDPNPHQRVNIALLDSSVEHIKQIYNSILDSGAISGIVEDILRFGQDEEYHDTMIEQEERAWPGESRFMQNGYYRMMIGRYVFAGSQFCRGADVLETGCGLGWGAYLVAHYAQKVTAVDIDTQVINDCVQRWQASNVDWLQGDIRHIHEIVQQTYDVCLAMETIEHFSQEDAESYIASVAKCLCAGGVFIGTSVFPETEAEAELLRQKNPFHPHIFTHNEMITLLSRHFNRASIIGNWMFIAVK
jgi:2-polyprenyl-3-methyl-5-hydroxy-6-metoxy-1,4-benzoquinol methylase